MVAMVSQPGSNDGRVDPVSIGATIGERYRIDSLIDEGAMGRVYLGEHVHMKKRVAIKVLRPELTRVPEVLARFEREALAAAHIEHQNVASARDFGKLPDGSVYLVLEYVEGTTLRRELKRGRFELPRALRIARQVALALGAAHALDIVHRDLKPENVMLLERGGAKDFVKVLDFGVAKVPVDMAQSEYEPVRQKSEDSLITKAGMVFGTPDYMAPEQALGQSVDARADLYSLGVMLFELLAGQRPFKADHELGILGQQLSAAPPTLAQRAPGVRVPVDIERLIAELLAREPSQRPMSAEGVADRLEAQLRLLGENPEPASTMRDRMPSVRDRESEELETVAQPTVALPGVTGPDLSDRMKSALPKPLQGVPTWVVLLMPITLLAGFALVVILFGGSNGDPDTARSATPNETSAPTVLASAPTAAMPSSAPVGLTDAQVESAITAGDLAVAALVERYPEDARAHLALARMAKKAADPSAALAALQKALELDPEVRNDRHVAALLWWTVQKTETQAATLALLNGPMKARGADILYDLAVTDGISKTLARTARGTLATQTFRRESTPAAAAAASLLLAPRCEQRKALVKLAENVGDERSARLLRSFRDGKGCGENEPTPCNSCLDPKTMQAALDAIEIRESKQPTPKKPSK